MTGEEFPWFLKKWAPGASSWDNVFLLVSADRAYKEYPITGGNHHLFARAAFVFKGMTDTRGLPSEDANYFAQEVALHEMTHGWGANEGNHCGQPRWDSNRACAMVFNLYEDSVTKSASPTPPEEFHDGDAAFHIVIGSDSVHSEYLDIRHRTEPVPNTRPKSK